MDQKLSVFHLFSELFPEYANDKDRDGGSTGLNAVTQQCMLVKAMTALTSMLSQAWQRQCFEPVTEL